jgi:5-methylcytosine-specific restriction endonuclease McrA
MNTQSNLAKTTASLPFNERRFELKKALRHKPKAQFYIDLANHIREQRWKKKDKIDVLCMYDIYDVTFDENLKEMFDWDILEDRDAYDAINTEIFHILPSCHNCEHVDQEKCKRSYEYYKEIFDSHYDITKPAKAKRAEFDKVKTLPRFEEFLVEKMNEQELQCYYCERYLVRGYEVDHLVPLCRGGSNHRDNLVLACKRCNLSKHDFVENYYSLDPEYVDWVKLEYKEGVWTPITTN